MEVVMGRRGIHSFRAPPSSQPKDPRKVEPMDASEAPAHWYFTVLKGKELMHENGGKCMRIHWNAKGRHHFARLYREDVISCDLGRLRFREYFSRTFKGKQNENRHKREGIVVKGTWGSLRMPSVEEGTRQEAGSTKQVYRELSSCLFPYPLTFVNLCWTALVEYCV